MNVFWFGLGFLGQGLFGLRLLIQWIVSERLRRSVVPSAFWYLSVPAGLLLFAYALWRHDLVFSINEGVCSLIFMRNAFFQARS